MVKPGPLMCGALLALAACTEEVSTIPRVLGRLGVAGSASMGGPDAGALSGALLQHPNPIISRSKLTFSSPPGGIAVVDTAYHSGGWYAGSPTAQAPAWVAIQLGLGPTGILVQWDDGGTYNYRDPTTSMVYGLPGAYAIEVSSDSSNGQDGTWTNVVSVTDNAVRTRGHAIDFRGKSWVKLVITAAPPNAANGVTIGEIDVHDISATGSGMPDDTWLFLGDSITAFAYDRAAAHQPSFAAGINALAPGYFPAMINAGIGGELASGALARLEEVLRLNPAYHFVVLGYGTNDAAGGQVPVTAFKATLQTLIDRLQADGRVPVLPHIPPSSDGNHGTIPSYNLAIDQLNDENQLTPGADLYKYFNDTPGLFVCPPCGTGRNTDYLHPNDDGLKGMNASWTQAMRTLYLSTATQ